LGGGSVDVVSEDVRNDEVGDDLHEGAEWGGRDGGGERPGAGDHAGYGHDRPGEDDSFTLETSDTLAGLLSQIINSIGGVAIAIAAISLVVGGVVIMNIMLVSVTERTREIGVRKALGAKRQDLLIQFLMESGTLSLIGGAIGVVGGVIVAKGVAVIAGFPAAIALWSVFAGLVVALSVGVFFGVYPARKAADLDPIVALRSEF